MTEPCYKYLNNKELIKNPIHLGEDTAFDLNTNEVKAQFEYYPIVTDPTTELQSGYHYEYSYELVNDTVLNETQMKIIYVRNSQVETIVPPTTPEPVPLKMMSQKKMKDYLSTLRVEGSDQTAWDIVYSALTQSGCLTDFLIQDFVLENDPMFIALCVQLEPALVAYGTGREDILTRCHDETYHRAYGYIYPTVDTTV